MDGSRHILEAEPAELADGLAVGQDGRERSRGGAWGFNLSNQGDGGALTAMGRTGVFFGNITFEIPIYDKT